MKNNKKQLPIRWQLILSNIIPTIITLVISIAIALTYFIKISQKQLESQLFIVAYMLSQTDIVIESLENNEANDNLNDYIDSILKVNTDIDIITVADMSGKRIYHLNKNLIGEHFIGGDDTRVYHGENYSSKAFGTLGYQLRYFYPIINESGQQVGFVMASTLMKNVTSFEVSIIKNILLFSTSVLLFGITISILLAKRIKSNLFGYEPSQIGKIISEREDIFDTLEEGIVAINAYGKLIFANKAALNILNINKLDIIYNKDIDDIIPQIKLNKTIKSGKPTNNLNTIINDIDILFDKIPIIENIEVIGAMAVLRNRSEVKQLAQQLTGVNHFVDSLRANNHEFMNKLHIILGLLEIGAIKEAINFITNLSSQEAIIVNTITERIENRKIAALLLGKMSRGNELNIKVKLLPSSYLPKHSKFLPTDSLVTILGNLIENALESINDEEIDDSENEEIIIFIHEDETNLIITVDDSGGGMSEEVIEKIKLGRFSTKGNNRGTGMTLIRNIIDNCGGELIIDSKKDEGTNITIIINKKQSYKGGRVVND